MKLNKILITVFALTFLFMVGCEDEKDDPIIETVDEFEVLVEYLEGDDGGYMNNLGSWIMTEGSVTLDDYLVLDLRSEEVFNNTPNPIAGAVRTTLTDMWTHAESATKPILVTCYSGQTASFAHMLLRLKNYEAYVMKFGMSMHDQANDSWTGNCSNAYAGDFVTTASPALPTFDYPVLETGFETAEEILDARIDYAISQWPTLITAANVVPDPSAYNIINYWPESDYLGWGHIDGAFQVTPGTLTTEGNLSTFDPDGENIFYCYTGQTAASACAYLTVLGYDVKSIKFGCNAMIWDVMTSHKWSKPYGG